MFLSKRGSTWYLYFRDSSGQRQKVSTHTRVKSEATKFLVAFKRDAWERQTKVRHISLSDFRTEILSYSRGAHRPKTTAAYSTALSEFLKYRGDVDLQQITGRDIEQFVGAKRLSTSHVTARARTCHDADQLRNDATNTSELRGEASLNYWPPSAMLILMDFNSPSVTLKPSID